MSIAPTLLRFQNLRQLLLAAGIFLIVLIHVLALSSVTWLRDKALRDAEHQLSQLSLVIAEQVERSLESVDGVLQVTVDRIYQADLSNREARAAIYTYLDQQAFNLPQSRNFLVLDQVGDRIVDSQSASPLPQNSRNGEHFRHYNNNADSKFHLSNPQRSRQTGDWYFSLPRPLDQPEGKFTGVVIASIDLNYFTEVFKSISLGETAAISFTRADGQYLFHFPKLDAAFESHMADSAIYESYLPHAKAGVLREVTHLTGVEQMLSYRALKNYPVVVLVEKSVEEIFAPWRVQAWAIGAIGIFALVILCTIGNLLMQLAKRGDTLLAESQQARKTAEQATKTAEQANRVKSEFLAGISHELRTPLNSIIGFSEVLLSSPAGALSDQHREYTQYINTAGTHLLSLINDLLDHAKIEANRLTIIDDKFALHNVINECMRLVVTQAESARVRLAPYESRQFGLRADPIRVRQIIFNLLSNAIKFTPADGMVEVRSQLRSDGALNISVIDTGIGMSEQEIAIALEPYGQVTNSMTRNRAGTGLGLPLVHALVKLHGGQVAIDSAPGKGTTVSVTLPGDRVLLIDDATRAA